MPRPRVSSASRLRLAFAHFDEFLEPPPMAMASTEGGEAAQREIYRALSERDIVLPQSCSVGETLEIAAPNRVGQRAVDLQNFVNSDAAPVPRQIAIGAAGAGDEPVIVRRSKSGRQAASHASSLALGIAGARNRCTPASPTAGR